MNDKRTMIKANERRSRKAGMDGWFMAITNVAPLEIETDPPKRYEPPKRGLSPKARRDLGSFVASWLDRYAKRYCK